MTRTSRPLCLFPLLRLSRSFPHPPSHPSLTPTHPHPHSHPSKPTHTPSHPSKPTHTSKPTQPLTPIQTHPHIHSHPSKPIHTRLPIPTHTATHTHPPTSTRHKHTNSPHWQQTESILPSLGMSPARTTPAKTASPPSTRNCSVHLAYPVKHTASLTSRKTLWFYRHCLVPQCCSFTKEWNDMKMAFIAAHFSAGSFPAGDSVALGRVPRPPCPPLAPSPPPPRPRLPPPTPPPPHQPTGILVPASAS